MFSTHLVLKCDLWINLNRAYSNMSEILQKMVNVKQKIALLCGFSHYIINEV